MCAQHQGDHFVRLQVAGKGLLDIFGGEFVHLRRPSVQVIQWQVVPSNVAEVVHQLAVAVQAQCKAADQKIFGGLQFFVSWKLVVFFYKYFERVVKAPDVFFGRTGEIRLTYI